MGAPIHAAGWSDERTERLRKLVLDGLSATQIADALAGGLTRNGVIGKAARLGLQLGGGPASTPVQIMQHLRQQPGYVRPEPAPKVARARPGPKQAHTERRLLHLVDLKPGHCRFPMDDPGPGFMERTLFCAADSGEATYCPTHQKLTHTKPPTDAQRTAAANARMAKARAGGPVWGRGKAGAFAE